MNAITLSTPTIEKIDLPVRAPKKTKKPIIWNRK